MNRLRTGGVLAAAGSACLALFAADAVAQTRKPWVDPPKTLAPQAPATPLPAPAPAPAEVTPPAAPPPAVAAEPARPAAASPPVRRAKAAAAPPRAASRPRVAERPRAIAPRPNGEARRARLAREGLSEGLEVMMLRTVTLPNGETVEVLEEPDPATMRRILRGRPVQ